MKINKEKNTITFTYDEVIKEFKNIDIEESINEYINYEAQFEYQEPYDEYELYTGLEHLLSEKYDFVDSFDVNLNGAYFDDGVGYSCRIVKEENITINGYTRESWLYDIQVEINDLKDYIDFISDEENKNDWEEEHIADKERIGDLIQELKTFENTYKEVESAFEDTYSFMVEYINWRYDLERLEREAEERVKEAEYILNLDNLNLEIEWSGFGANLEYDDLSDNLKDLIKIEEEEVIEVKTIKHFKLK